MLSLHILALLQLIENHFFWGGGLLRKKHSMTLNGGSCILNYSRAALTNCPKDLDLLFFKVGQGKEKQSELVLIIA